MRLHGIVIGLLLLAPFLVQAQETGFTDFSPVPDKAVRLDVNRTFWDIARTGIGLPEHVLPLLADSVRQLFLRIPKDKVVLIPDPAQNTPEAIPLKLKGGLVSTDSSVLTRGNILVFPHSIDRISQRVQSLGGTVLLTHRVGIGVTAEVPQNQLVNVA